MRIAHIAPVATTIPPQKSGSVEQMTSLLTEGLVAEGAAVLMISSELSEIVSVCDRVYVMRDKTIVGELGRGELSEEGILRLAMHQPGRAAP